MDGNRPMMSIGIHLGACIVRCIAGLFGVLSALAKAKLPLGFWPKYSVVWIMPGAWMGGVLHLWGWYSCSALLPLFALSFLVCWLDLRKRFPR